MIWFVPWAPPDLGRGDAAVAKAWWRRREECRSPEVAWAGARVVPSRRACLVCIDRFYRAQDLCCTHDLYCGHEPGALPEEGATPAGSGPQVVYVSPLKALATDIQQNLEAPL